MSNDKLYHHGVKGQRWGVRRYQNKDGSLTALGEKRMEKLNARKMAEDLKARRAAKKSASQTDGDREENPEQKTFNQRRKIGKKIVAATIATAGVTLSTITVMKSRKAVSDLISSTIAELQSLEDYIGW